MSNVLDNPKVLDMVRVVKEYHSAQTRNNGKIPYSVHCLSVSEILMSALVEAGEESEDENNNISIACSALGHDLLEDTTATRDYIRENFGDATLALIEEVTNDGGDDKHEAYVEKLMRASEEALLIKYSDLIDNTISVAYGLHDLGVDWVSEFYLPIMNRTEDFLNKKVFNKYPKTVEKLRGEQRFSKERLLSNLKKFNKELA